LYVDKEITQREGEYYVGARKRSFQVTMYGENGIASGQPEFIYKHTYGNDYMIKSTVLDKGHTSVEDYIFDHEEEFNFILDTFSESKKFDDLEEAYPTFNAIE